MKGKCYDYTNTTREMKYIAQKLRKLPIRKNILVDLHQLDKHSDYYNACQMMLPFIPIGKIVTIRSKYFTVKAISPDYIII